MLTGRNHKFHKEKNTGALFNAREEICLEVNAEKIKYLYVPSRFQTKGKKSLYKRQLINPLKMWRGPDILEGR
jgi:hypothetical protein